MINIILKKELKSHFRSPLAYALAGLFSLTIGWIFFNLLVEYLEHIQNTPHQLRGQWGFLNGVVLKLMSNINFILLFMVPLITMKSFSEEKKEGTMDLFDLSSVSDFQLISAKFLGVVLLGLFLIGSTFLFPIILKMANFSDFNLVFSGYLGLSLNLMCYVSIGLFASALTTNPIICALLSFLLILVFWIITWTSQVGGSYFVVQIGQYLGVIGHFQNVVQGIWGIQDIVYYTSFIIFFLFLTTRALGSRKF